MSEGVLTAGVDTAAFQALYPFASHSLEVAGGRMSYVDEGPRDAPPLLMLHGNPTWSFYYRDLVAGLSARYRVIAPDHIGCGRSSKPEDFGYRLSDHIANVGRLIEALDLQELTLVVHDWGGAIGMGYAVDHPERIARFVVFNTAAFPARRIPFSIDLCRLPGFGALAIRGFNAFSRAALFRCICHRDRLTDEVRAGYLAPYDSWANRVAQLRFVQDIPMTPSHPSHALLTRIGERLAILEDKPMLLLWGGKDFCFDDSFYEQWRRRFPNAIARHYPDAGHYVVEDAHERILPLMKQFLAGDALDPEASE